MSEDLLVTLGVKDKGARAQITALNKEIRYLDKEFKNATNSSKTYEDRTASLQKQQDILKQKIQAVESKMSAYKKQMEEAAEGIVKKKARLEELNNTEGDNEKAIEQVTNQLNKYEQQLKYAERDIKLTENELQQLNKSLEEVQGSLEDVERSLQTKKLQDYANKLKEMSERMEATAERFRNFGDLADSAGNKLIALGSPIMALCGYATKVSIDFESAMSEVQATSGATGDDLNALAEKAKEMGAKTSKSATDSAKALQYMSLAGWDTKEMLSGLEPILRMSELASADLGQTSNLVTDSMSSLGIEVKDLSRYLDIVAKTQASANTGALDMMDAYISCGGIFKELNTPLEESATLLGILANRGIKGAEAGTSLNSVLINLMGVSGQARDGLEALGVSAYDSDGNFRGVTATLKDLKIKLSECTEEQRQQFASMIGGKTQIDTLMALLSGLDEEYGDLYNSVSKAEGSLLSMAETMQDNTKGNITRLKSQLEGLGIQLGEHLLPHINDLIGHLNKAIEWFGSLEEGTQKNIIKFGLMSVASGTLLKGIGSLSGGIGDTINLFSKVTNKTSTVITKFEEASKETGLFDKSLGKVNLSKFAKTLGTTGTKIGGVTGTIAKFTSGLLSLNPVTIGITAAVGALATGVAVYKTNQELANSSCIRAKEDLSLFEKVVATFTGKTFESTEALKEKGLVLDELSESFSTEFKHAVDDATKGSQDFSIALREINLDGVFSNEESAALNERVNNLVDTTIATINSRKEEQQQGLKELFSVDGTLSENETLILQHFEKMATTSIEEVEQLKNDINTIKQRALEDGRILNEQEIADIQSKEQRIREIQLQNVATTNEELIFAKNDFKNRVATMDAEAASEYLEKQRAYADEQILQKAAIYDTQIELLQGNLDAMDEATRTAAEQEILNLQESKRNEIATWEQYFTDCLGIVTAENSNLEGRIDESNGRILTNQGVKCAAMLNTHSSYYKDLDSITTTGLYKLYNENDQTFRDVLVNVDSTTGKIIGTYDTYSGEMSGLNEEIAKDTKKMVSEFESAQRDMQAQIESTTSDFRVSGSDIKNSNNEVVGSLESVTKETDGTYKAILNINGQPMEIKTNANSTKNQINDVATAINNLPSSKTIWVNVNKNSSIVSGGAIPGERMAMPESNYYQSGAIPNIPTARAMPSEFTTMELSPSFYSSQNPIMEAVAKTVTKETPRPTNSNINYKEIADVIAKTVAQEISKLKIEPVINNLLNGKEITSLVSQDLAWQGRRIR